MGKVVKFATVITMMHLSLTSTICKSNTKSGIEEFEKRNVISGEEDCASGNKEDARINDVNVVESEDYYDEESNEYEDSEDDEYEEEEIEDEYEEEENEKSEEELKNDDEHDEEDEEEEDEDDVSYEPNIFIQNPCIDLHKQCSLWASEGECIANPVYMLYNCQKSCYVCIDEMEYNNNTLIGGETCKDKYPDTCPDHAFQRECNVDPIRMKDECPMSCGYCFPLFDTGVPQYFDDDDIDHISVLQVISTSNMYFLNEVMKKSKYARIKDSCANNYNFCSYYAKSNECEDDPDFMNFECSLACRACDQLDIDIRCPLDHDRLNKTNIWKEGDLEKMYRRFIEDQYFKQYEPKIISQPNNHTSNNCSLWVITFDNFITEEECDRMIELAAEEGYERSETVSLTLDGVDGDYEGVQNAARTSSNSWCDDACHADSLVQGVIDRIANVTGIPRNNQEDFQLLKYDVGQFYTSHTDYIPFRADGPRIATFFIYLNNVTSGGETAFPKLGFNVTPKKGKALLFPGVQNLDPMVVDLCSEHEALPIIEGVKHAANVWLHMRDFQHSDDDNGCPTFSY